LNGLLAGSKIVKVLNFVIAKAEGLWRSMAPDFMDCRAALAVTILLPKNASNTTC